ncbi:MAG: replication-associated recombination protein A [Fimbriimonadaceae bacterium]
MRPTTLDEVVGQPHILDPDKPVRAAIESGRLGSVILWAPPGCGKTTLAAIIGRCADAHVELVSAVTTGVSDVRAIAKAAQQRRRLEGRGTVLVLDEIHHFNRTQQDALLGCLEDGTIQLIGVTTENPFLSLAPALLSRARVLPLKPLDPGAVDILLDRALSDVDRGLGARRLTLADDARRLIQTFANGDARQALNVLEAASLLTDTGGAITAELVREVVQQPMTRYDRQGDLHYDTISAFIKSVRGSDPDAALHYLARMLEGGEDPRFLVRRLLILASEDIGNADPQALVVAAATAQTVERVGMPEARIAMAQLTTYLAAAPKSNAAYVAIDRALADLHAKPLPPIPLKLRNAPAEGLAQLGHGRAYRYPHDSPEAYVRERYLPEGEWGPYYEPSDRGYEARIRERMRQRGQIP